MFKYIVQSFTYGFARTFWTISDFFTGDTQMRRIIRDVNQQTLKLRKRITKIDQHIMRLMDANTETLYKMEKLYEQPNHDIEMMKYHFKQSETYKINIKSLGMFKNKCEIVTQQILDQILHAQLADDMNEARQVLKQVNDYNDQMNVAFNMEQYNMETLRGNDTRNALDDAVTTAKGDVAIQINSSEQKLSSADPTEEERFANTITEIASRVHQKRNQNNGAIEVMTVGNDAIPTQQQLEERFDRLRSQ